MKRKSGFTLISTLICLAILVVVVAIAGVVVSSSLRTASSERDAFAARKSALAGLEIALGELQTSMGPDTRISATADVLNDSTNLYNSVTVEEGREAWVGVWKSRAHDLVDGDDTSVLDSSGSPILADIDITRADVRENKSGESAFEGWLVSLTDSNDDFQQESNLSDISSVLKNPVVLKNDENGDPHLIADRVKIADDRRGERYFAYAVEDEGTKADLSWNQSQLPDSDQSTNLRINTALGPDYEVFNSEGQKVFPVEAGKPIDANSIVVSNGIKFVRDPKDLKSILQAEDGWLIKNSAHFTVGSKAVMTDVKKGGLRRDLSLAFEMDGEADFEWNPGVAQFNNPLPLKFSQQFGEFVGSNLAEDVYTSVSKINGFIPRYVYGDRADSGRIFSNYLVEGVNEQLAIHGPTWFAMRDFGTIYKRIQRNGNGYSIDARSFAPNINWQGKGGTQHSNIDGSIVKTNSYVSPTVQENYPTLFDRHFVTGGAGNRNYSERPYRVNYAPVFLGTVTTMGVTNSGQNFAVSLDPMFYLWNPYNHKLKVERYVISFKRSSPGYLNIQFVTPTGNTISSLSRINDSIARTAGTTEQDGRRISIAMDDIEFEPGEVLIFSPTTDVSRLTSSSDSTVRNHRHPFNTAAFKRDANLVEIDSGILLTQFNSGGWKSFKISDYEKIRVSYGFNSNTIDGASIQGFLGSKDKNIISFNSSNNWSKLTNSTQPRFSHYGTASDAFSYSHSTNISNPSHYVEYSTGFDASGNGIDQLSGAKQFFGVYSLVHSPVNSKSNPAEIFTQFNPLALITQGHELSNRLGAWNQEGVYNTSTSSAGYSSHTEALEEAGVVLPSIPEDLGNGYWGNGYDGGDPSGVNGVKQLAMVDIPVAPPTSLAQFANANLAVRDSAPLYAIGNSFASIFIDPESPYGQLKEDSIAPTVAGHDTAINFEDVSWKLNDELFDRYYLSGLAADFQITDTGYAPIGTLRDTLEKFYDPEEETSYLDANATPVLQPYIPGGVKKEELIDQLDPNLTDQGYKKLSAFSMINGAFNVNSTSVEAWSALLRANRDLELKDGDNHTDAETGTPFARTVARLSDDNEFSGVTRLSDEQIQNLAEAIVDQVKLRGPFMSLSDFVNHRVGEPKSAASKQQTHYMGALQAAIEESGINDTIRSDAGNTEIDYSQGTYSAFLANPTSDPRPTSTGIIKDITQADLLISLAPRLTARSDTFRIHAFGEIRNDDSPGSVAICEAVVQRFPDFIAADTNSTGEDIDPDTNEAWDDEAMLSALNQKLGRRFRIVQFRWLSPDEYKKSQ